MSYEDRVFVQQNLNIKESALFFSLPGFEQKHGVNVAYKMAAEARNHPGIDLKKLIRLGLLHDIGKATVRLSIYDKALLVIIHKILPPVYNILAKLGESEKARTILRQFYVHKHHGSIGSKLLKKIGESDDIINEVASHDRPAESHDLYMKILDQADSTY